MGETEGVQRATGKPSGCCGQVQLVRTQKQFTQRTETNFLSPGTMRNTIVPGFTFGVFHGKIDCQSIQKAGLYHAF